jgi:lantibiotic leader peptide-processing serine protease
MFRSPQIGIVIASSSNANFKTQMQSVPGVGKVVRDIRVQYLDIDPARTKKLAALPPNSSNQNPMYNAQWNMNAINVEPAWQSNYKGSGARVVVIDNGFMLNHPDMAGRFDLSLGQSFNAEPLQFQQSADPNEFFFSHGTHVSGIIAANDNTIGVVGVAPSAQIIPVKALYDAGYGDFADIIAAISYAGDLNADVINMSFAGYLPRHDSGFTKDIHDLLTTMQKAINYAYQKGTTLIAAAGNESINRDADSSWIMVPADMANVIQVAATGPSGWALNANTSLDAPAFYTNYGQSAINLSAPGGNIDFSLFPLGPFFADMVLSPANDNDYWYAIGTSMAAPHVAGVAALIVSKYGHLSPAQMKTKLQQSSDDLGSAGKDKWYGMGRVNAARAVQ